jgi:hypothetical protein
MNSTVAFQREDGHGGEAGVLQQLAEGEFEIVHKRKGKHPTLNIEGRTSNESSLARAACIRCSAFKIECSMFILFATQRHHCWRKR